METSENPVQRACRLAKLKQSELATKMGLTPQALDKFGKTQVPAERVKQMVAHCRGRVTPHELRPDLYPADFRFPKKMLNDERKVAA